MTDFLLPTVADSDHSHGFRISGRKDLLRGADAVATRPPGALAQSDQYSRRSSASHCATRRAK